MNINWKVRLTNKAWWLAMIPTVTMLIGAVLKMVGVEIALTEYEKLAVDIVNTAFCLLALIGVVNDPTTEGLNDSTLAMTYEKPKQTETEQKTEIWETNYEKNEYAFDKELALDNLVNLAESEIGYVGKKSAQYLDSAKENTFGKYTKYARDLDNINYFYGKKQGFDWCCVFICWLFYETFGETVAKKLLGQPLTNNYGAGCKFLCEYLKKVTPHGLADIHTGDIVCYSYTADGDYDHVGIVTGKDQRYITVIQGNAESIGGGGVGKFVHSATYPTIKGVYRPYWEKL